VCVLHPQDLTFVLGSSLQISPANEIPTLTAKKGRGKDKGKMVIVNLQKTPKDRRWDQSGSCPLLNVQSGFSLFASLSCFLSFLGFCNCLSGVLYGTMITMKEILTF